MKDDYLWDRSGVPDPDVERLERLLRPLGHGSAQRSRPVPLPGHAPRRQPAVLLAAAAVAVVAIGTAWLWRGTPSTPAHPGWTVGRIDGAPTIESKPIGGNARLPVGGALDTDAAARARIDVADIGQVDVDPGSRVELVQAEGDQYRLRLRWGTMHARIFAPPGRFVVETPSSTVTDLGCAYTLEVDDEGVGSVHVTSGWVGFEWRGRESFIPAGAMCATRPGVGPGTPHAEDVSDAFRIALDTVDFGVAEARPPALAQILAGARREDALTLWHLLTRVDGESRARVFDRLAALVPPPTGVTRDGVLRGDRTMIDRWWDELGFGSVLRWREWKQQWSEQPAGR